MLILYSPADYVEVGIAAHSPYLDRPEFVIENPIGTYEAGVEGENLKVYYQHISSIPTYEEGYGLNLIGVKYKLK